LQYHVTQQSFNFIDQWIKTNKLSKTKWICVAPGSPRAKTKWKTKNFSALVDMLIDRCKVQIVILGSPEERDVMAEMKQHMHNPAHMEFQMGVMAKNVC
jgi:ADP-heptose:LPS heptosyltransferase